MKINGWNIQGIKKPQVLSEIKFLIRKHSSNLIFILETMVNENNIRKILPQLGFNHYDFVPWVNHLGAIAVLWNNGVVHASVLLKKHKAIHMLVYDTENLKNCIILGIYAPAQAREKNAFWNIYCNYMMLLMFHDALWVDLANGSFGSGSGRVFVRFGSTLG